MTGIRGGRDRIALVAYAGAVVAATAIHHAGVLAVAAAGAAALAGRDAPRVSWRALRAIVVFNAVVTISYAALVMARGDTPWHVVALLNARVYLITILTALAARRINMFKALAFSRSLVFLLTVAYGQVTTFRRLVLDYRLAFASRSPAPARLADRYRHAAATASLAMRRSMHEAGEITMAMSSRGFFDD